MRADNPKNCRAHSTSGRAQARSGATTAQAIVALSIVLASAALALGTTVIRQSREARAVALLAAASQRNAPLLGQAVVQTRVSGRWLEMPAGIGQADGRVRTELRGPGPPIVILDDGTLRWQVDEDSQTAVSIGPSTQPPDTELLVKNYSVTPEGQTKVAGQPTTRIAIRSRHTGRPAAAMWVEPTKAAVLRHDTFDAEGELAARTEFKTVDLDARLPRSQFEVPENYQRAGISDAQPEKTTPAELAQQAGFTPRAPEKLPAGYVADGLYAHQCPRGRVYGEFRYQDGLRTLSVFERARRGGWGHGAGGAGGGPHGAGRGQGPRWRAGRGEAESAEAPKPALVDEGITKSVRQPRGDLDVIVTGDLTEQEIVQVLQSVPEK